MALLSWITSIFHKAAALLYLCYIVFKRNHLNALVAEGHLISFFLIAFSTLAQWIKCYYNCISETISQREHL